MNHIICATISVTLGVTIGYSVGCLIVQQMERYVAQRLGSGQ